MGESAEEEKVRNMEPLEKKLEKPEWKQYIPLAGWYWIIKAEREGKPNFMDYHDHTFKGRALQGYQLGSIVSAVNAIGVGLLTYILK